MTKVKNKTLLIISLLLCATMLVVGLVFSSIQNSMDSILRADKVGARYVTFNTNDERNPNLFNYMKFTSGLKTHGTNAGSTTYDDETQSFTVTSTGGDTYTETYTNSDDFYISNSGTNTYIFSWVQDKKSGYVNNFIFDTDSLDTYVQFLSSETYIGEYDGGYRYYLKIKTSLSFVRIRLGMGNYSGSLTFKDIKIEKADTYTDYSPAQTMVLYDYTYGTYGDLPTPTRTGYTFNGWFTASSGGDQITNDTTVTTTTNQTLYAQWTAKKYYFDLNIYLDGQSIDQEKANKLGLSAELYINGTSIGFRGDYFVQQDYGSSVYLNAVNITYPAQYYFDYYTIGGTKYTSAELGSAYAKNTKDTWFNVFVYFKSQSYTLTFDGNGGFVQDANYWTKYQFGSQISSTFNSDTNMNDITVTTVSGWEIIGMPLSVKANTDYTITFNYEMPGYTYYTAEGGGPGLSLMALNSVPNNSTCLSYSLGYTTLPSNTSGKGTLTFNSGSYTTIYLVLNNGYIFDGTTITYKFGNLQCSQGANQLTTKTVSYNNSYTDLPTPTRDGYLFGGWYAEINGSSSNVLKYGRAYMYTDKLSVHFSAYNSNWATQYGRMISCTQNGGWNIETDNNSKSNAIQFIGYDSGASNYRVAKSSITWSSLSAGWHDFDLVFDGTYLYGYIDGEKVATSPAFTSGKIAYHSSNGLFVGGEAVNDVTTPEAPIFPGYIANLVILNSSELITSSENSFTVPMHDVTLKARWIEAVASTTFNNVTTYYSTLEEAFAYANTLSTSSSNMAVVTLLNDYTQTAEIQVNKHIIFKADSPVTLTDGANGALFRIYSSFKIGGTETGNNNLTLNLNNIDSSIFVVYNNNTIDIYGGTFEGNHGSQQTVQLGWGGCVDLRNSAVANIHGGTFQNFYAQRGAVIGTNGGWSGSITINGGLFTNNKANNGAVIGLVSGDTGTTTINAGSFTNNTATGYAGVIDCYGIVNITGGNFTNNTATSGGGVVSQGNISGDKLNISGGTFENNSAGVGGAILIQNGTIGGSVIIRNNTASTNGGGVEIRNDVTITGGTISGNTAVRGGGIYINSGTLTMTGGSITNNTCGTNGSQIYNSFTCNLYGGDISSSSITGYAVYSTGTLVIGQSGSTTGPNIGKLGARSITGVYTSGTFTMNVGNIYTSDGIALRSTGTTTINNGTIDFYKESKSMEILMVDSGTTTINGGTVSNGGTTGETSDRRGYALRTSSNGTIIVKNGTFSSGWWSYNDGRIDVYDGNFTGTVICPSGVANIYGGTFSYIWWQNQSNGNLNIYKEFTLNNFIGLGDNNYNLGTININVKVALTKTYNINIYGSNIDDVYINQNKALVTYDSGLTPNVNNFTINYPKNLILTTGIERNKTMSVTTYNSQALYLVREYEITINPNGGSYEGTTSNTTISGLYGSSLSLNTPTRTGYAFNGWAVEGNGNFSQTIWGSTGCTRTLKTENGVSYIKYQYSHTGNGSDSWANFVTENYEFVAGKTYVLQLLIRVNSLNGSLYIRHARCNNDYYGCATKSIYETTSGWQLVTLEQKLNATFDTDNKTTAPRFEIYTNSMKNDGEVYSYDFDIAFCTVTEKDTGIQRLNANKFTILDGNATLTANWTANTYKVTVHPNGGTFTQRDDGINLNTDGSAYFTVVYGKTYFYALGLKASKTGYSTVGVFDKENGGIQLWNNGGYCLQDGQYWDSNNLWSYPGDVDLYFQYKENTYNLKFTEVYENFEVKIAKADGTVYRTETVIADSNHTCTLTDIYFTDIIVTGTKYPVTQTVSGSTISNSISASNEPTRKGYSWGINYTNLDYYNMLMDVCGLRWNGSWNGNHNDGLTLCIAFSQMQSTNGGTAILTLLWTANEYTITFDSNDGTVEQTTKTISYGQTYGELPTPTREGYDFKGWQLNLLDFSQLSSSRFTVTNGDLISGNTDSDPRDWNYTNADIKLTLTAGTYTISIRDLVLTSNHAAGNIYKADGTGLGSFYNSTSSGDLSTTFTLTEPTTIGIMLKILNGGSGHFALVKNDEFVTSTTQVSTDSDHTLIALWEVSFKGNITLTNTGSSYVIVTITSENYQTRKIVGKGTSITLTGLSSGDYTISIRTQAGHKFSASVIGQNYNQDNLNQYEYRNISLGKETNQFENVTISTTTSRTRVGGFYG